MSNPEVGVAGGDQEPGATMVYLVRCVSYDSDVTLAVFSTEGLATEYQADYMRTLDPDMGEEVLVTPKHLDPPRRSLRGAYVVELALNGEVVDEGWQSWTTPDGPSWDSGVRGAHWWVETREGREERRVASNGSAVRAVGLDRGEALARGCRLLELGRDAT